MAIHTIFLLFSLCVLSTSAYVFKSIDCGSSKTKYIDENHIVWTGDEADMQNGESKVVQTSNFVSPVMGTLRVFTSTRRKKNCYSIKASKGERVIVRASFLYGNYDGLSSPPSFDLLFDGNHWATVDTSVMEYAYYEVTYVTRLDYVSVCVAQTKPGQFPFISAIEVRSVELTMYSNGDQDYPLHLIKRVAYGANETIRYKDDPYDRLWTPVVGKNRQINVPSDTFLATTTVLDQPPAPVLQNAVTAVTPTTTIQLLVGSFGVPIYLNMYFSEVAELDATTQKRSFQVLMDNVPLLDQPVVPPYGDCMELYASNLTVSSNTINFTLVPTDDSTLPPLINAMEVFSIGDLLTDGTNAKDVEGLSSLQNAFATLRHWGGDPCLPAPDSWEWIKCSSDAVPRVTSLYLSSFDLTGVVPDFSIMDALETIDFHNNILEGPIPEFLAKLPNLKLLNLASNQFSAPIPDSLSKKNGLNLVVTGNPDLCISGNSCKSASTPTNNNNNPGFGGSNNNYNNNNNNRGIGGSNSNYNNANNRGSGGSKSNSKPKGKLGLIIGITGPNFIIILAVLGFILILKHKRRKTAPNSSGGANMPQTSTIDPEIIGGVGDSIVNETKVNMEYDQGEREGWGEGEEEEDATCIC